MSIEELRSKAREKDCERARPRPQNNEREEQDLIQKNMKLKKGAVLNPDPRKW